ncbi:MAG: hypothetical protein QM704_27405 [Anaeromyxobacteraceae bacterium]
MEIAAIKRLDAELRAMVADERRGLVAFLRRLDVMDLERAFCEFNCGSAFEYLTKQLHLCEGTAAGRVSSMRLMRRFPRLEAELESGRLNPTQLLVLGPVITPANFEELVSAAAGLTKEKTKELAVRYQPRAVPADGVRRLPRPVSANAATSTVAAVPVQVNPSRPDVMDAEALALVAHLATPAAAAPTVPFSLTAPVAAPRLPDRGSIEPVAEDDFQLRAHMDGETKRLFDELAGLLANVVPDRAPARLLAIMVRDSLEAQKRKRGLLKPTRARKPAPTKEATPGIRQPVAAGVRRAVLERDGYRCRFGEKEGHRCEATENLTMEHKDGALVTGSSTVDELLTYCFPHNLYAAFLKFGPEFMLRKIAEAREERAARRGGGASDEHGELGDLAPTAPVAGESVAAYGTAPPAAPPYAAAA